MRNWWIAIRPKTLTASISPVLIGSSIAWQMGSFSFWVFALTLVVALGLQIGCNLVNDYSDYTLGADSPLRQGPIRACQAGLISVSAMKFAALITFALTALIGLFLVTIGGWVIASIFALSLGAGYLYTAGPYPLGYHGFGDLLVFFFFGPAAVVGAVFLQTMTAPLEAWLFGAATGLFSVAILTVNNCRDEMSDRASGKKTLVVCFGARFGKVLYGFSLLLPFALLAFYLPEHPALVFGLLLLPYAYRLLKEVSLAKTAKIQLIYSLITSITWCLG